MKLHIHPRTYAYKHAYRISLAISGFIVWRRALVVCWPDQFSGSPRIPRRSLKRIIGLSMSLVICVFLATIHQKQNHQNQEQNQFVSNYHKLDLEDHRAKYMKGIGNKLLIQEIIFFFIFSVFVGQQLVSTIIDFNVPEAWIIKFNSIPMNISDNQINT